ncbi:MAG: Mrp/NBP35 family ATP-binding protein [Lachnospiraceae bacterium]|nr:Mrp/NBP35 family ATP-binding protein [Lachnospiraceae bacterium]
MAEEKDLREEEGCTEEKCAGCEHADNCPSKMGPESFLEEQNQFSNIKNVIAVVSGKGGVGKSFVTGCLAVELARKGFKVGILDADITGPSIQKMFGLKGNATGSEEGIFPMETEGGIRVISVNMLLDDEETPVIWRGPVLASVVKQFWTDVIWGELDYLLVDLPPGTGDVPLTVFQSLPVDGVVIVTSPQSLVTMIVKKAYNMAVAMNVPVLGIVENYSYLECPDCGKKIHVFGDSMIESIAAAIGVPVLGKMPIRPELAALSDKGRFEEVQNDTLGEAIRVITEL